MPLCDHCHARAHGREGSWNTSELTKKALEVKRQKGLFTGGRVPYGYGCEDGVLHPSEPEIAIRQLILLWRNTGKSLWEICWALNTLGVATKSGQSGWAEATIRKICKNGLL